MRLAFLLALGLALIGGQAAAQSTTYTFTAPTYTTVANAAPGACTVGECTTYTAAQRVVISLTFAAPLAANLPQADRSAAVTAFTISDGVRTTSGPGPLASLSTVDIGTDATGKPDNFFLLILRTPGPPYLQATPGDANSRISLVALNTNLSQAASNAVCNVRALALPASGPGNCTIAAPDLGTSQATSMGMVTVTAGAPIPPVPTMTEWAMILFGVALAGLAALHIHRRRFAV